MEGVGGLRASALTFLLAITALAYLALLFQVKMDTLVKVHNLNILSTIIEILSSQM